MFQKEARVNRREAEKEAKRLREELLFKVSVGVAITVFVSGLVGLFYFVLFIKSQI
jgi:hypothetical protein